MQIATGSISNAYKGHEREAAERSWCPLADGPEAEATQPYQTLPSNDRGAMQKMLPRESEILACSLQRCSGGWQCLVQFYSLYSSSAASHCVQCGFPWLHSSTQALEALKCWGHYLVCSWRWACFTASHLWEADLLKTGGSSPWQL